MIVLAPTAAWVIKRILSQRYDPNKDPQEDRIAAGRARAMSKKEHARLTRPDDQETSRRSPRLEPDYE
ncbi:MAG TPA: hypothetical protein VH092_27100 [Urbifossiella sp.]|nr:hypothetical protein [Urbifossiella sp.]